MNTAFQRVTAHRRLGLFGVEVVVGRDEWLTPRYILDALGPFDLDPCAPIKRPWATARRHYTLLDDGLRLPWDGRVWCNPPYGQATGHWLRRCADHGNAIALTFARTETAMFFDTVWDRADAIYFFRGRLSFYHNSGKRGGAAGAPSVLIAYGAGNIEAIEKSTLEGKLIVLRVPGR